MDADPIWKARPEVLNFIRPSFHSLQTRRRDVPFPFLFLFASSVRPPLPCNLGFDLTIIYVSIFLPSGMTKRSGAPRERLLFLRAPFSFSRLDYIAPISKIPVRSVQSGASHLSQGFEDYVLGSSPWGLADNVATYCPGRPSQLTWKNIIKSCER